jgi:predicted DNA-binding protein
MPSKYTAFRCPAELLERAQERAKAERRSLSNYIVTLIAKDVATLDSAPQASKTEEVPSPEKKNGK